MKYNKLIATLFINSVIFSTLFLSRESAFAENSTELSIEHISKKIDEVTLQQRKNSEENSITLEKLEELSKQIQKIETDLSSKNEIPLFTEKNHVKNEKIDSIHLLSHSVKILNNRNDFLTNKKEQLATLRLEKDKLEKMVYELNEEEKSLVEKQAIYEQQIELVNKNEKQANTKKTIIDKAQEQLGKPYVYGANGPDTFDCSGLVQYVFSQVNRTIGRTTTDQELAGKPISIEEAQEGDLLFWGSQGSSYHVAISMGNGSYIHAPVPGAVVEISTVASFAPSFGIRITL